MCHFSLAGSQFTLMESIFSSDANSQFGDSCFLERLCRAKKVFRQSPEELFADIMPLVCSKEKLDPKEEGMLIYLSKAIFLLSTWSFTIYTLINTWNIAFQYLCDFSRQIIMFTQGSRSDLTDSYLHFWHIWQLCWCCKCLVSVHWDCSVERAVLLQWLLHIIVCPAHTPEWQQSLLFWHAGVTSK